MTTAEDHTTKRIDTRSQTLMHQFWEHVREVNAEYPGSDERKIFEAWAIQKIASLQLETLRLAGARRQMTPDQIEQALDAFAVGQDTGI